VLVTSTEIRSVKQRRSFTAEEKARILAEYEAAATPLERAALMRREGLYSSLLANWRGQLAKKVPPRKRGRPGNPLTVDNARLRKENERLERRLAKAERTIDALGKAHALLQMIAGESEADSERSKSS
jgi:transposase-like protein